ncbi:TPA: hypothetical protein ACGRXK_001758 [Escherichia coli]
MKVMEELRTRLLKALRAEEEKEPQSLAKSADEALSDAITPIFRHQLQPPQNPPRRLENGSKRKASRLPIWKAKGARLTGETPHY